MSKEIKNCLYCGKETTNYKYCSLSCGARNQERAPKQSGYNTCKQCLKEFEWVNGDQKVKQFCNSSCSAKYSNARRSRTSKHDKPCLNCEKITRNVKFCSEECANEKQKKDHLNKFLNNDNIPAVYKLTQYIRDYILAEQGGVCDICKCLPMHNGLPLNFIADHIDGNSTNNTRENFRLICPNCDTQLPTYKAKNKNSGRAYRRQRYADGKSF